MKHIKRFEYKYLAAVLFAAVILSMTVLRLAETEPLTYAFINLNGAYQRLMLRDYMYDADPSEDTLRNRDGQLVSSHSAPSDKALAKSAAALKRSSEWLAQRGIPLIYIQAANKTVMSPEDPMTGIRNNTYIKLQTFLRELQSRGIEYVDTRDWITASAADAFYYTDHHWRTETCFGIMQDICRYLNEKHDFGIADKYFSSDSYSFTLHRKAFLGAEGRRTGIYYAGLDDFTDIRPEFTTDFRVEISDREGGRSEREGSFEGAVMDTDRDISRYSFEDSAYYVYWGGDYGRVHVTNRLNDEGRRVLIFKDSYGIPVSALLTNAFSSMDVIDLRYYSEDKSMKEIIEETKPDAVLYIYGPGYISRSSMFSLK